MFEVQYIIVGPTTAVCSVFPNLRAFLCFQNIQTLHFRNILGENCQGAQVTSEVYTTTDSVTSMSTIFNIEFTLKCKNNPKVSVSLSVCCKMFFLEFEARLVPLKIMCCVYA